MFKVIEWFVDVLLVLGFIAGGASTASVYCGEGIGVVALIIFVIIGWKILKVIFEADKF